MKPICTIHNLSIFTCLTLGIVISGCLSSGPKDVGRATLPDGSSCKPVIYQHSPGLTFNDSDYIVAKSANVGCRRYYGNVSCLKVFRKIEERNYHAICSSSHHSNT